MTDKDHLVLLVAAMITSNQQPAPYAEQLVAQAKDILKEIEKHGE
jgi:hypothetical protein